MQPTTRTTWTRAGPNGPRHTGAAAGAAAGAGAAGAGAAGAGAAGAGAPIATTKPQVPTVPKLTTILGACLESCVHELLYVRSIYPRECFASTRYLGVACHACRHPAVVDYIFDALSVAVPALVSGVADELSLVIIDARGGTGTGDSDSNNCPPRRTNVDHVLERYAFSFDVDLVSGEDVPAAAAAFRDSERDAALLGRMVRDAERGFRNVLLRIIAMDGVDMGTRRGRLSSTTSFKLCLHAAPAPSYSSPRRRCRRGKSEVARGKETAGVMGDGSDDDVVDLEDVVEINDGGGDEEGDEKGDGPSCRELEDAIQSGSWFRPDPQSCAFVSYDGTTREKRHWRRQKQQQQHQGEDGAGVGTGLIRPLKSVNVPSCGLRMELLMEVDGGRPLSIAKAYGDGVSLV